MPERELTRRAATTTACMRQDALQAVGRSQSDLARELGITPAAVSQVILGKQKSWRVAALLSRWTGIDIAALFPEWRREPWPYTRNGTRS